MISQAAAGGLDLGAGRGGEGRRLDGELHLQLPVAEHLQRVAGAGDQTGLLEGVEADCGARLQLAQPRHVDDREVGGIDEREVLELRNPAVEGHLAAFETGAGGTAGAGFLAAHAEAAAGALAGGDAATLAQLAAAGAGLGLKAVEREGRHGGPQE